MESFQSHLVRLSGILLVCGLAVWQAGCGAGKSGQMSDSGREEAPAGKVLTNGYLYDAKLTRHGKPTSFRLELFATDSVVALGGRGYLGKGALRGRMTADSLTVYFPTTNEFVVESLAGLLGSSHCTGEVGSFDALDMLRRRVDQMQFDASIQITSEKAGEKRPVFRISARDCQWMLRLQYESDGERWWVRDLLFDNGAGVTLSARLREQQNRAAVPANRFRVTWPDDAVQLTP